MPGICTITGRDQMTHLFCGQTSWKLGQPPVSKSGDSEGEIVTGFAVKVQIPQKRSERGDQLLCGRRSTFVGTF
jgi:hypothetical protein